jgi:iron complex outermembrane receptor protein
MHMWGLRKPLRRMALTIAALATGALTNPSFADDDEVQGEVIVTAQKRAEDVQDVPSSVSVFGDDQLKRLNATSLIDYAGYVPGFNVNSGGTPGQTSLTLRGVAPVGPGAVVGTYIDDTPLGSSGNFARATIYALDMLPDDIERVEVLRGPQGTLYGAGAMGGLVKYAMRNPDLQDFGVGLGMETFNIENADDLGWGARGWLNAPFVTDRLGLRVSAFTEETAGYGDNAFNDDEDTNDVQQAGGRATLLFQPTDSLSIKVGGLWQRIDADDSAGVTLELTGTDPPTGDDTLGELTSLHGVDRFFRKDVDFYSATLDWDLGWGSFVSASSYSDSKHTEMQDATFIFGTLYPLLTGGLVPEGLAEFELRLNLEKWTQELRLASAASDRFEWLVGAFYTEEDSENHQEVVSKDFDGTLIPIFEPFFAFARLPSHYEELALFSNATFKFSPSFDITAGIRWAENDQDFRQVSGGVVVPTADDPGTSSESVFTYALSPRWHVNEDTMLYARVATGYRPGGPNVIVPNVPPSVDSDELINYEIGLKTEFANRRALLNAAVFYIDWSDIQQAVGFGGVSGLDNVGDATSRGVELESMFGVTDNFRLGVNVAWTEAQLDNSPPEIDNSTDAQLPGVPELSASLTADYSFAAGDWDGRVGGGVRYVDEQESQVVTNTDNLSYVLPSYEVVDLNAELARDRWTLRLFVRNLLDERAYTGGGTTVNGLNIPIFINVIPLQPRTIGLSLDVAF